MPCYRCGVRQTDPSRGQSPWKRGVRRYGQVLICPGCQDTADWTSELDQCSQCSSVHLVKRLGEVECRDCGAIMPPSGEPGRPGLADDEPAGAERGGAGSGGPGRGGAAPAGAGSGGTGPGPGGASLGDPGVGDAGGEDAGLAGTSEGDAGLAGTSEGDAGLTGAGRGSDLSEEVARALDRVLGRSLVSQSLQRAPDAAGQAEPGPRRPPRASSRHHTTAHPGAERHRAARPGESREGAGRLDEVMPGAFAG